MLISIVSYKGGVAKTTSAIHLAGALQEHGSTLLVDGDRNAQGLSWGRAGHLPFAVASERDSGGVRGRYKHIVIDTPARPEPQDLAALSERSDLVIIPTTPTALSLSALIGTIRALGPDAAGRVRVLITIVPPWPSRAARDCRAALGRAGLKVFDGQIRRLSAFEAAADQGVLVRDVRDPRAGLGWADYEGMAREVLAQETG